MGRGNNKYEDILDLPHPEPKNHRRMTMTERAAQFSPFAALTGYGAVLRETERRTERRIELDEYEKEDLDRELRRVQESLPVRIEVTYFEPDMRKEGGAYLTVSGTVRKMDLYRQVLILEEETEVPISEIIDITMIQGGKTDEGRNLW